MWKQNRRVINTYQWKNLYQIKKTNKNNNEETMLVKMQILTQDN